MKSKKSILLFSLIVVSVSWLPNGFTLEKPTHEYLNQQIAQMIVNEFSLDAYLKNNLGFQGGVGEPILAYSEAKKKTMKRAVFEWMGEGGIKEDEPEQIWRQIFGIARNINHFHNPLGGLWKYSGLNDTFIFHYTGESSILWAQNPNQKPGGTWSWHDARKYYYTALTGRDINGNVVASKKEDRDPYFAKTFRALGQLMHLVHDASVPAHSRNQIHVGFHYEKWVEKIRTGNPDEQALFGQFIAKPISFDPSILNLVVSDPSAPIPIANIIDTDKYSGGNPDVTAGTAIGIAEYANANFLSERSIFKNFPYPNKTTSVDVEDREIPDPRGVKPPVMRPYYIKKRDGEGAPSSESLAEGKEGYRLATVGFLKDYITKYFPGYLGLLNTASALDGGVYNDYAEKLLPRAVGYSAGLLEYFFRGNIEITLPDSGVYAQTDNVSQKFKQVRLKARNTTPNGEEMTDGTIELVVKYKEALENPFQSKEVATSPEFSYIIVPASSVQPIPKDQPIIPRNQPREFVCDLTETPVPLYATDIYLQVVYKGKLGLEDMAVAVGFKDISEPTPIDIFNDMDRICINGGWCVAGDAASQTYGIDAYPHNLIDSYIRLSSLNNPQVVSPANYNFYIQQIAPGSYSRVFILGDYAGSNMSYTGSGQKIDGSDTWPHIPGVLCPPGYTTLSPCSDVYKLIKNQTDIANGIANRVYPTFNLFRGLTTWGGGAVENWPYPNNSVCPE